MGGPAPYWRLSAFYLFYFAALGALLPYWALYLHALGFSATAIGVLMALFMATKVIAPNLWAWLADVSGRRMPAVRLASLAATLAFTGAFFGVSYGWLAWVMASFSFFWNAALPQFEATTLNHLMPRVDRYSHVRLWGSVGFILSAGLLGELLERYGTGILLPVLAALLGAIWLSSLLVGDRESVTAHAQGVPLARLLRRPEVFGFLAVCFLMQASHGPYYAFYSIYLEKHGYGAGLIGGLWVTGVVAEIGVFLIMHRLLDALGPRRVLLASLALAAVRWLLIGWGVDSLAILGLAQVLHAATFGAYHGAAMHLVHQFFVGRNQGRGQALYSSVSFGAGGAVGTLAAGYLWSALGGPWAYSLAALLSVAALTIAWLSAERREGLVGVEA
jgi:PPP family 3-phenylpropionic acid transporter